MSSGGFSVDATRRLLFGAKGESIPLNSRAFDTLLFLIQHRGELLDKASLMKAIWPNVVVEDNNLNQSIWALRRVLGETPGEHRFIVTVPGRGYRFVAPVEERSPTAPPRIEPAQPRSTPRRFRAPLLATPLLLLLIAGLILQLRDHAAPDAGVSNTLSQRLGTTGTAPAGSGKSSPTNSVAAYDAYLAANALLNQMGTGDAQSAITLLEEAVRLDPGFAQAWAALAGAYASANDLFMVENVGVTGATDVRKRAQAAAMRAAQLAPDSPFVLTQVAKIAMQQHDWITAERRLKRALDLSEGNDFEANLTYAAFLADVGRPRQSIRYLRRAAELEPLLLRPVMMLESAYYLSGENTLAQAEYQRGRPLLGDRRVAEGNALLRAVAQRDRDRIEELLGTYPTPLKTAMRRGMDDPPLALAELRRLLPASGDTGNSYQLSVIAHWAIYFGDHQLAMEALRAALKSGLNVFFIWRPDMAVLRNQPAFADLLRDAGLVSYWHSSGQWGDFCVPTGNGGFDCPAAPRN